MPEQWYSIVEYARKFQLSDMTVRRRIKNGKLHAVLKEGKYFIPFSGGKPVEAPVKSFEPTTEPIKSSYVRPQGSELRSPLQRPQHLPELTPEPRATFAKDETRVDGKALLEFCNEAVRKFNAFEQQLNDSMQNKIKQYEAQLKAKDLELSHLYQQVEDLQVLVKILESKHQG